MVPPGQYGVIISKTHGIDPDIVRSGEFRWVWYKLIPTNVQVAVFNPELVKFPINYNNSLPSGDRYSSFVGITDADFSWNLQGEITFKVNPDFLVSLTERYNLSGQEDLDRYLRNTAQDIERLILRVLSSAATDSVRLEQIMSGNADAQMEQEIKARFPEIRNFSFSIHTAKIPDFILYRQIRLIYEDFMASQREFISSSFGRRAESHIETQLRFEELERYGDLLTRYPILLEFLLIENDIRN
jgi:hypothetical protein